MQCRLLASFGKRRWTRFGEGVSSLCKAAPPFSLLPLYSPSEEEEGAVHRLGVAEVDYFNLACVASGIIIPWIIFIRPVQGTFL